METLEVVRDIAVVVLSAVGLLAALMMVVTGILLVTYEYMVRYTLIGTMLNGKKTRPKKVSDESSSIDQFQ